MLKTIISLTFASLTILASVPALANEQVADDQVCLDRAGIEVVADLADAQANCSSDYDCGYGNICEYGQCRPKQCWNDNQCFSWEQCDSGRCRRDPWATSCRTDSDCFGARICRLGYCKKW